MEKDQKEETGPKNGIRFVVFEVPYQVGKYLKENAEYHRMEVLEQEHTINFLVRIICRDKKE